MSTVFQQYPKDKNAFINPGDYTKELPGFPEVCITTFSENIINTFIKNNDVEKIAELYTSNGALPVYAIQYADTRFGLFLSRVGAPACVAGLEEIIAMGAKKIVQFGCCGVLNQSAVGDRIILPVSAVRDEGTSYHYIPGSEEIEADISSINIAVQKLENLHIPFITGKVWTTDAIYRETPDVIQQRRQQGCIAVEMECSACLAVARFREVPIIQFLFGADSLDAEKWEPRDLTEYGIRFCDKYMAIALEFGAALQFADSCGR